MKKLFFNTIILLVIFGICSCNNDNNHIFNDIYKHCNTIYEVVAYDNVLCFVGKIKNDRSVGLADLSNGEIKYDLYKLTPNTKIVDFALTKDDCITMLTYTNLNNDSSKQDIKESYEIINIDNNGNIKSHFNLNNFINLTDALGFHDLEVDIQGNFYVVDYRGNIWVLGGNGDLLFKIDNKDFYFEGIGCSREGLVVVLTSYDENDYYIKEIDVDKKSYGNSYGRINEMKGVHTFTKSLSSGITYIKNNQIYNYSFDEDKEVKLKSKKINTNTITAITMLDNNMLIIINSTYDQDSDAVVYNSMNVNLV